MARDPDLAMMEPLGVVFRFWLNGGFGRCMAYWEMSVIEVKRSCGFARRVR